jgi:hypothetical protein
MNNDSPWTGSLKSPLDRAIDRAVRTMMHVDPAPGLRRRVLSRLDSPGADRRLFLPGYAWGAAAVVILIAGLMFTRAHRTEPGAAVAQPSAVAAEAPPPRENPTASTQVPVEQTSTSPVPSRRITREAIPIPRIANVFGARTGSVSAAADTTADSGVEAVRPGAENPSNAVAPLVIAPLTPAPIETPAIVIPPLVIAPPKGGQ